MGRWALIAGARGGEKTAVVRGVIDALRASGVRLGGFVQEPVDVGDVRVGYEIARLVGPAPGERVRMARKPSASPPSPAEEEFCSLVFDGDAFARAAAWVAEDAGHVDVVVIDEVSKLEASGRGHTRAIEIALASAPLTVLCVRADQLFAVLERLGLSDPIASLAPGEGTVAELVTAIRDAVAAAGVP
jgi:nucleoside-triphosphatase THEP1